MAGPATSSSRVPFVGLTGGLGAGKSTALQALEGEVGGRIESLRARLARADALAPALQQDLDLLEAGQLTAAIAGILITLAMYLLGVVVALLMASPWLAWWAG